MDNLSSLLTETTRERIEAVGLESVKASLQKLYDVWDELDLDPTQKIQRAKITWTHVNNLLMEILEEEKTFYKEIKDRVRDYADKVGLLSKALFVPAKEVNGSLIEKEQILRQELNQLNALKEKRKQAYQNLKKTVLKYCQILNINEKDDVDPEVPSETELKNLEQRVSMLKLEKEQRGKKFLRLKKELTTILETTELPPETALEEEILSGKEDFLLSGETFEAMEEVVNKAKQRQSDLEARKEELVARLCYVWGILKIDEEKKVEFLSRHLDVRSSTIKSMEEELERCEDLLHQNKHLFINALREDLEGLWDACYASEHQRRAPQDDFKALEEEVGKWHQYRDDVAHILKKIHRRQQLFNQLAVFESKASDPSRFRNRRGHLLQEERERKQLQKELPALEKELFRDIQDYEADSDTPFLYMGGDFRAFAANQWAERKNQSESRRLQRHKNELLKMQSELSQAKVSRGPIKRPASRTPQSAPCKLLRQLGSVELTTPETSNFLKRTPNTVDRLTLKNRRPQQKRVLRERNGIGTLNATSPNTTTYSEFSDALNGSSRRQLQSSILSTKKPGGTRTSKKKSGKQKSTRKSVAKGTKFSPARGKFGLPFIL